MNKMNVIERGNALRKVLGIATVAVLTGIFAFANPAAAQGSVVQSPALGSSLYQVTGTATTTDTTGVTGTLTSTTTADTSVTAATTGTTASGSVLLPATGADLTQQPRNVSNEVVPLLMLIAGLALVVSAVLMLLVQRSYRRQDDDR